MESDNIRLQHYFFFALLGIALIIMFYIFKPFLSILILAISLAIVFEPIHQRILRRLGNRKSVSAFLTVVLIVVVVLIPLTLIGGLLFNEARNVYVALVNHSSGTGMLDILTAKLQVYVHSFIPDATLNPTEYLQYGLQWILQHLSDFFSQFFQIILSVFIMIIALFYILRDGATLRKYLITWSPLSRTYDEDILQKLKSAINSVVKGSIVIAIVQGTLASIGAAIFGLPNPIIWGTGAMIASFIPGIGTSLVMVPAIIYLFFLRGGYHAGGLLIWQIITVALVDNTLAPQILRYGMKIHPLLILLSVLGGITLFGPIGFILGPIMLAFLFALLDIYPLIIKK